MIYVARRQYTEDDKAAVFAALTVNKGNVKATSRNLEVPEQTVRDWKKEWESGGPPEIVADKAAPILDEFHGRAVQLRDKLMDKFEERVEKDDITTKDIITSIGIFTDKIRLIEGLPTSRQENVSKGLTPEELGHALAKLAQGAIAAAREREIELSTIEGNKTPIASLPAPPAEGKAQ